MARYYLQDNDNNILNLDIVGAPDLDLPSGDYRLINTIGEGSQLSGEGQKSGRKITFTYYFTDTNEQDRNNFLKWFNYTRDKDIFLYKEVTTRLKNCSIGSTVIYTDDVRISEFSAGDIINGIGFSTGRTIQAVNSTSIIVSSSASATITNAEIYGVTFLGRMKAYPQPKGGEGYDNIRISENVKFEVLSPEVYFTSTSVNSTSLIVSTTSLSTGIINIKGDRVACQYVLDTSTTISIFQLQTYDNYGFRIDYGTNSSSIITVNTTGADLQAYLNGSVLNNVFYFTSTPFYLESGNNTVNYKAAAGTITINYNERRL